MVTFWEPRVQKSKQSVPLNSLAFGTTGQRSMIVSRQIHEVSATALLQRVLKIRDPPLRWAGSDGSSVFAILQSMAPEMGQGWRGQWLRNQDSFQAEKGSPETRLLSDPWETMYTFWASWQYNGSSESKNVKPYATERPRTAKIQTSPPWHLSRNYLVYLKSKAVEARHASRLATRPLPVWWEVLIGGWGFCESLIANYGMPLF